MYCVLVLSVTLLSLTHNTDARGAGRAFPMLSENYAIENFQSVNPSIEWDPTNFLVDKSGQFAHCHDIRWGYEETNQRTPEGVSIGAVYDYVEGDGVDVESVNNYIMDTIDKWMRSGAYRATIRDADLFGCSVRPGCSHRSGMVATIACLFSPGRYQDTPEPTSGEPPTPKPTPRPTRRPTTKIYPTYSPKPIVGGQDGLAFTPQQYSMAESITGNPWDRSHFLENLSGYEASCSMLGNADWAFNKAIPMAEEYGIDVMGLNGEAPNLGSTQQAMEEILKHFKQIRAASNVGCSVIPDCMSYRGDLAGEMWVIVTCIYEDPSSFGRPGRFDAIHGRPNRHKRQ